MPNGLILAPRRAAPELRRVAPHVPGVQGSGRDRKWTGRVPMAARRIQRKAPAGPVVEHQIVFADHDARPILGKRVRVDDDNAITFAVGRSDDRCPAPRSEEHTSELQSLMRNSYAVVCLKKK